MALKHVYYSTTITVAYNIDIPDGMDDYQTARELLNGTDFFFEHISPDLAEADWPEIEVDIDDWTDEVEITSEQVLNYLGRD